ncbi:methylenetetrahydrofolate reductase [Nonomuraea jiangxiensis]|uniref:Methylenetetrahydrofolate reductase n=1 Tax=Nonomuraea jiangxiensis TaxID=633440 RepID=A0A1G8A7A9_9ACTN|nr:methylenetetrahydrofolate reductase [Nonomuraea jiangxiensis]SDH16290.1 methylenetetrahydrofolate reductase (NADPH) [Nonomuraea jiangxiensis]
MATQRESAGAGSPRSCLADLLRRISYEVTPFPNTERNVLEHVPVTVPLTVTVTKAKGIDATLGLTERLVRHGYTVAPHLPARQFRDRQHVADVVARLREARVRSVFVVGGDAPRPAGEFEDAYALLRAMREAHHPFEEVGIAGYPEGHPVVSREALELALKRKAPMATRVITQICFHAGTTADWAAGIAAAGIGLPVHVGIPGPVNRHKLMRITANLGLGQSARFLRKHRSLLWRFLLPGAYQPARLARELGLAVPRTGGNIRGLHIFTFDELSRTELWRRRLLESVSEKDDRS